MLLFIIVIFGGVRNWNIDVKSKHGFKKQIIKVVYDCPRLNQTDFKRYDLGLFSYYWWFELVEKVEKINYLIWLEIRQKYQKEPTLVVIKYFTMLG